MMLMDDIIAQKGIKLGWIRHSVMPKLMTMGYYYFSRALYHIEPTWSFAMNAAFESHAEHEYMQAVKENPDWDNEPVESEYFNYYPKQKNLGDLMRRIGLDERDHMNHSLEEIQRLK